MSAAPPREGAARPLPGGRTFLLLLLLLAVLQPAVHPYLYTHEGEDCFITFRYARNQARGHGLVYNTRPPEWVEGYSNFTWTLLMVLPAGLGWSQKVFAQWANGVLLGALVFAVGWWGEMLRRRLRLTLPLWLRLLPAVFVALDPFLHYHVDRCLETLLYTLLFVGAGMAATAGSWRAVGACAGLAAITRPEGFLCLGIFGLPLVLKHALPGLSSPGQRVRGRMSRFVQEAGVMLSCFAIFVGPVLIWRFAMYGAILPNTVPAKVPNIYVRGFGGLERWMELRFWTWWFACAGLVWALGRGVGRLLAAAQWRGRVRELTRREGRSWAWAAICVGGGFAGMVAFYLSIGDLPHVAFRYLVPILPFQILLVWIFLVLVYERAAVASDSRATLPTPARRAAVGILASMVILSHFIVADNTDGPETRLHLQVWRALTSAKFRRDTLRSFYGEPVLLHTYVGKWFAENVPEEALLAADQMGQFGYYAPHDILDLLGLMDRQIALNGLTADYLLERRPDYLVIYAPDRYGKSLLWGVNQAFYWSPVREDYELATLMRPRDPVQLAHFEVWVRRDSPYRLELPPVIWLGPDGREFFKRWRVHSYEFIGKLNLD